MQNPYLRQLLEELDDLRKRLGALERLDVNPPVSSIVTYSGTPTAGQLAQWTGAGTVTQSGYDGTAVARYSGAPAAGQVAVWTGQGTVNGNAAIYVDSNGRVGVGGITDPNVSLEVTTADGVSAAMRFISHGTALVTGIGIYTPRGTRASPSANQTGDILGQLTFGGYDTNISNSAHIRAEAAAVFGSGGDSTDSPGNLIFATTPDGSGTSLDRMTVFSTGVVGVGNLTSVGANVMAVQAGTSSNDAAVGGGMYVDSATNANGTTVETDLGSYSVPANTLAVNNQSLEFEAWITLTNNANTKTIKFKFGATVVTLPTVSGGAATLHVRGFVVRTGAATQDIFVSQTLTGAVTTNTETFTTAAETLSGAVTMKFTGQSNSASNDVKQEFYKVTWHDANL